MHSRSIPGPRPALVLATLAGLALALALALPAPAHAAPPDAPTVAVLYFDYSGKTEDMEFLRKGLTQMLVADLAGTPGMTVVERARLQEVLAELDLAKDARIDRQSALRVGKLLSAQYLVLGGYLDFRGTLQVSVQLVDVETGVVLGGRNRRTKVDDFFRLEQVLVEDIRALAREHLPGQGPAAKPAPAPASSAPVEVATAPAPAPASDPADTASQPRTASRTRKAKRRARTKGAGRRTSAADAPRTPTLDASTAARYGRALDAMDRGDTRAARKDLEAVVSRSPDFHLATVDLSALTR